MYSYIKLCNTQTPIQKGSASNALKTDLSAAYGCRRSFPWVITLNPKPSQAKIEMLKNSAFRCSIIFFQWSQLVGLLRKMTK